MKVKSNSLENGFQFGRGFFPLHAMIKNQAYFIDNFLVFTNGVPL